MSALDEDSKPSVVVPPPPAIMGGGLSVVDHQPPPLQPPGAEAATMPLAVHPNHEATEVDADETGEDGQKGTYSRRFFPRVKQLVNPEWEHFLQSVLHSVQAHQAHQSLKASGVEDNAWYQVFHSVYGGIAADSCSVPQGKNRYHKFKDKIVELWRYMAVTDAPEHDINGRLWKMGRTQWEMYKSLLVVAGKSPVEITMDGSYPKTIPGGKIKTLKKGRKGTPVTRQQTPIVHYEPAPKKNYLPSPLHDLHIVWKMTVKHNDPIEMGYIRKDYQNCIRMFIEECHGGPETPNKLLWHLEGLNELRDVEQEDEIRKQIGDAYKAVLQRYVAALNKKKGGKMITVK
ncbi:expressed unknown protein [Seminavis robusta]|uniref:Uncharacterized protein n=1 Tax=Seminavis robusta TaxID=568900 RepID=A0A9N8EKA6_9STRA|nr:expressed unknown protein [Seminavis robusta]|eukprot:Sro1247_g255920.1 n/a (344) ;mRNA; f:27361-28565